MNSLYTAIPFRWDLCRNYLHDFRFLHTYHSQLRCCFFVFFIFSILFLSFHSPHDALHFEYFNKFGCFFPQNDFDPITKLFFFNFQLHLLASLSIQAHHIPFETIIKCLIFFTISHSTLFLFSSLLHLEKVKSFL